MPKSRSKVRRSGMAKLRSRLRQRFIPLPWDNFWYDGNWTAPYFYTDSGKVRFPLQDRAKELRGLSSEQRRDFFLSTYPEIIAIMIAVGYGSTILELPGWRTIRYRVRHTRSKDRRRVADWLGKLAHSPHTTKGDRAMLLWYRRTIRNGDTTVPWYTNNGWVISIPSDAEVPPNVNPFVHVWEPNP